MGFGGKTGQEASTEFMMVQNSLELRGGGGQRIGLQHVLHAGLQRVDRPPSTDELQGAG